MDCEKVLFDSSLLYQLCEQQSSDWLKKITGSFWSSSPFYFSLWLVFLTIFLSVRVVFLTVQEQLQQIASSDSTNTNSDISRLQRIRSQNFKILFFFSPFWSLSSLPPLLKFLLARHRMSIYLLTHQLLCIGASMSSKCKAEKKQKRPNPALDQSAASVIAAELLFSPFRKVLASIRCRSSRLITSVLVCCVSRAAGWWNVWTENTSLEI